MSCYVPPFSCAPERDASRLLSLEPGDRKPPSRGRLGYNTLVTAPDPQNIVENLPPARRGGVPVRILFGSLGWPSGLIEIASWAKRQALADAVIVPVLPEESADRQSSRAALGAALVRKLLQFRPHVVGFRVEGGTADQVRRSVAAVRQLVDCEVVLGGPTATSHPVEVLEYCGADYAFCGEAEEPFVQFLLLAGRCNSRDQVLQIPGLACHYGGRSHVNTLPQDGYERTVLDVDGAVCGRVRACVQNLVRPVAGEEVLGQNRLDWSLLEGFEATEFESLFFTAGRGCPGACTFCAKLHGQDVRTKSAEQLLEEIEQADRLVADGRLRVGRWQLFEHVDDPLYKHKPVSWAAVYDEDFFLDRRRAVEFFALWNESPLRDRYRLSVQTNPRSLLTAAGAPHAELFHWIDRLKPMIQLGAESFYPEILRRWRKRHTAAQLETVLEALDRTRQDYTVFQLLTDFDSTAEEFIESLRLLARAALRHRRMRIAASPFTIPLYDSDTRRLLEFRGDLDPERIKSFADYEQPQPGWMNRLVADLADRADAELHRALQPRSRDAAILAAVEAVADRLRGEETLAACNPGRWRELCIQAERACEEIRAVRLAGLFS